MIPTPALAHMVVDNVYSPVLYISNRHLKKGHAEKYGEKAVRKNLTIPAWLNTFAENNHINFSQVLQDSLIALYQQKHHA